MKPNILTLITLFFISTTCILQADESITLTEQTPEAAEGAYLYEIVDGEVLVNDKLITLFALSKDGLSASYRNKTDKKTKPKYTIHVYNRYGLLIGTKTLGDSMGMFGGSTLMEPGEVSAEKIHMDEFPLPEILKQSQIHSPEDIMAMKWIVLSDTNSK